MDAAQTRQHSAVNAADVTAFLRSAALDPQQWDIEEITRKVNQWVHDNLIELGQIEAGWSSADKAAHYAEFGAVSAVDFIEQCVIEAGPDTAPWSDLQHRVDAGEFDDWPSIWRHPHGREQSLDEPNDQGVQPRRYDLTHESTERDERIRRIHQRLTAIHHRTGVSRDSLSVEL